MSGPLAADQLPYCAFKVKVTKPSGTPFARVPVELARRGSDAPISIAATRTDAEGVAEFCDAPLDPVDLIVGFDACGAVWVRSVKATWPATRQISVTYVDEVCDHFNPPEHCQILLRVQDDRGRPVVGARFEGTPSALSSPDYSDAFGRLFRIVNTGGALEGTVAEEGHEPSRVSAQCRLWGDREIKVILHKR